MHIGITGASGLLGQEIVKLAGSQGHRVTGFSRNQHAKIRGCRQVRAFKPQMDLSDIQAVVHLAGESILGVWTKAKRERILRSRIDGTRWVVESMKRAASKPVILVSASATGIYGNRGDEILTESSAPDTSDFLGQVASAWELEGRKSETTGARCVLLRIAMVLGQNGGALPLIGSIFRLGLGGNLGSGNQWMPWIHVADIAGLVLHAIQQPDLHGPLNAASPVQIRNEEFTKAMGEILKRPTFFAVPAFALKMLAREESVLVLNSQRVVPEAALKTGYRFRYPDIRGALKNLYGSRS
jgi:uncharacterized protein (TIGR01777 family)